MNSEEFGERMGKAIGDGIQRMNNDYSRGRQRAQEMSDREIYDHCKSGKGSVWERYGYADELKRRRNGD